MPSTRRPSPAPESAGLRSPARLHLLGEPRLAVADEAPKPLERRVAAMLAMLLLDGPQPRALLARWLWPDAHAVKASRNLRQRLFRLRQTAGDTVVQGQATLAIGPSVVHDLDIGPALAAGDERWDLLGGCDYADCEPLAERVDQLRLRWRHACTEALDADAGRALAEGRADDMLQAAERLLHLQPGSERAWQRVMQAHHLRGDRAQALASFEQCRQVLLRMGSEPSGPTLDLMRQIRGGPAPAVTLPVPRITLARPPRLVGREADWSLMMDAWQHGRLIVLRGAPGIGKSRLAADFMLAAGGGVALKVPLDGTVQPFALAARLWQAVGHRLPAPEPWVAHDLARLQPAHDGTPGGQAPDPLQPQRLRLAWAAALRPWVGSGLGPLWIDDLQWADPASLDLLLTWLEPGPHRPPVLLSLRHEGPATALEPWLDRRAPGEVLDHALPLLAASAVREFVASLDLPALAADQVPGLARHLLQRVGGHPFLMLEHLRAGIDTATPTPDAPSTAQLVQSLARRIAQLAPGPLRLLRLAALAGGEFSVPLAAEVLGVHALDLADDWRGLTQAQLMQDDGTVFDLVIEAARASLPAPIATCLHEQLAEIGARRGARAEWVADHWEAASRWAPAALAREQAARHAAALSRPTEALRQWDRAADCHGRAGDHGARWRAERSAVDLAGIASGAQDWLARAQRLVEGAPSSGPDRFDALLALGKAMFNVSSAAGNSQAVLQQAMAEAGDDAARQLQTAGLLLPALATAGDLPGALRLAKQLAPVAELQARDESRQLFHSGQGLALFYAGHYADSARSSEVALAIALERNDLTSALLEAGNLIPAYRSTGELPRAADRADVALALWERLDRPRSAYAMTLLTNVSNLDVDQGRFDRAIELATTARDHFRGTGSADWCAVAEARLFQAWLRLGQLARARQALSPLPADAGVDRQVGRLMQECRLATAAGQPAAERLRQAVQQHLPALFPRNRLTLQLQLAASLPADEAAPLALAVLQQVRDLNDGVMLAPAHAHCADAIRRLGRREEAATHAAEAWESAAQHAPFGTYHVEFCWWVHQAAMAGARAELAAQSLRSGLDWIERALPHVPPEFVDSFRHRNAANRALLSRATQAA